MTTLDEAAAVLQFTKMAESRATEARLQAEIDLLKLIDAKDEGSVTATGQLFKVTVTYGVNRSIDAAALSAIKPDVPAALFDSVIDYAPKLKLAGLRFVQANEPDTYALLAQAITAKPAKPSVKLEAIVAQALAA